MKKETLDRGIQIIKEIKELKNHLDEVLNEHNKYNELKGDPTSGSSNFSFTPFFSTEPRQLRNQFVPFPLDKFMKIYKANVEEEIGRIEKEFENLQDIKP